MRPAGMALLKRLDIVAAVLLFGVLGLLAAVAEALPVTTAWARIAMGARAWVLVVLPAVAFSLLVGVPLGLIAARVGRLGDRLVTRMLEMIGGFPTIVLVALLRAIQPEAPLWLVAATLALIRIPVTVRHTRMMTVRYRASELYAAERALGASSARVVIRHMLPMMAGSLASVAVVGMGVLVGIEAAMTFVGLGAPIDGPTWGGDMGRAVASGDLGAAMLPAAAVAATMMASFRLAEAGVGARNAQVGPCISRHR